MMPKNMSRRNPPWEGRGVAGRLFTVADIIRGWGNMQKNGM